MNMTRILAGLCRWTARIIGTLLVLIIVALAIGEGVPNLLTQAPSVQVGFFALAMTVIGILLGWRWEAVGGAMSLAGYSLFIGDLRCSNSGLTEFIATLGLPGALYLASAILRLDTEDNSTIRYRGTPASEHSSVKRYKAHWGEWLTVTSSLLTVLCLGMVIVALKKGGLVSWIGAVLVVLMAGCALFTIRGYTVTPDSVLIHRLFWATRVPLAGLEAAWFEPRPMRWNLRFGNGGFFSFTGFYRNKFFGPYRAFATDRRLNVVLQLADRTIVVSPVGPEDFVDDILDISHAASRRASQSIHCGRKGSRAFNQARQDGLVRDLQA